MMKRIDRWKRAIGLYFLRSSGYDVPTEVLEKVMQPRVLETSFSYTENALLPEVEKMYNDKLEQICLAAKPYVDVDTTEENGLRTTTYKLIIQTPL